LNRPFYTEKIESAFDCSDKQRGESQPILVVVRFKLTTWISIEKPLQQQWLLHVTCLLDISKLGRYFDRRARRTASNWQSPFTFLDCIAVLSQEPNAATAKMKLQLSIGPTIITAASNDSADTAAQR